MRDHGIMVDYSASRFNMEPVESPGAWLALARGRDPTPPPKHFRGDSGDPPAPESLTSTEKAIERNFPLPSIYRTDSAGNLVSDYLVDPIILPDQNISAPLPEKNVSRDSQMEEASSSAAWQLYNNVMHDTVPLETASMSDEDSAPASRKKSAYACYFFGVESSFSDRFT